MKNEKLWNDLKEQREREDMEREYKYRRLNTPCRICGRMPTDHPRCNCLVLGCDGYRYDTDCPDYDITEDPELKLVSTYEAEGYGTVGIYEHTKTGMRAHVYVKDEKSQVKAWQFNQGPVRTAEYKDG